MALSDQAVERALKERAYWRGKLARMAGRIETAAGKVDGLIAERDELMRQANVALSPREMAQIEGYPSHVTCWKIVSGRE